MTHTHNPAKHAAALLAAAALIFCLLVAPAAAFSGAGSGTEASPYIITTPAQLQEMANDLSAYYQIGNDVSLPHAIIIPNNIGEGFTGVLDGAGFKIYGDGNNYATSGVYFYLSGSGTLKNIHFYDIEISSTGNSYGLIGGYSGNSNKWSSGNIENCLFDTITIIGKQDVGLISYVDKVSNVILINSDIQCGYSGQSYITRYHTALYYGNNAETYTGTTENTVILSTSFYNYPGASGYNLYDYRVSFPNGIVSNCYVGDYTGVGGSTAPTANGYDGETITSTQYNSESWWLSTMNMYDWANVWRWDSDLNLPILRRADDSVPPTISAVTASPATGGQLTEYTLTATATTEAAGGISGYQWSYSTDSGSTWTDITGATTNPYTWTPGQSISGTVNLKVTVTGADGGTADSYAEGFTPTITVITPPAISSITTSRPLQKVGGETTLTAIFSDSQTGNTYQWYYRVSGGSWQAITGATQPVSVFTPAVTGTLDIKIIATNAYGESSELTTTLTVLPTYTPDTISETTPDISISAENKYQATKQFTLTTDLFDLEYFTPNLAYLAQGNAVYYIDSAEQEVIPVTNKTGNTITAAYIGSATAVLTDSSGNTAVYDYSANDWQYIEQNGATILAATTNYAATINGQTLTIYNLNGNKIAETTTTLTNLAGNDNTDIFAGYSGQTITYYWVSNGAIQTASQTITQTISGLHQVPDTQNFVVSTNSNTLTISISPAGAYTLTATSDTTEALTHTQATSINVIIGVAANEIYVIGADGETDGTYVTGSTLNDASIAKSTGLYAITGGEDRQAYILAKSTSSTWQLSQVVSFGDVVDHSQISTTGTYAAVATGHKLYLLEALDISTGTYILQGVVIGSTGSPYAGKLVSINGDNIRTDNTGRFIYPVQPNVLYTIVADSTTTDYTATNAALQTLAIRLKPNPFAQSVSYDTTYNSTSGQFEMSYTDSRDLTESVTWVIRETGTQEIVSTQTSTAGQTAYWEVPFDKVFTSYQISMIADRQGTNVENVWIITPSGSQPINIPGLDETGRNIIFGCVLMIFGGLFGVMHSTKGAILTVAVAGIMTYLGLLTIPWPIIMIAGTLAVLAALAKGSSGQ